MSKDCMNGHPAAREAVGAVTSNEIMARGYAVLDAMAKSIYSKNTRTCKNRHQRLLDCYSREQNLRRALLETLIELYDENGLLSDSPAERDGDLDDLEAELDGALAACPACPACPEEPPADCSGCAHARLRSWGDERSALFCTAGPGRGFILLPGQTPCREFVPRDDP